MSFQNLELRREYDRQWRKKNRERIRKNYKDWAEKNRDKLKKSQMRFHQNHPNEYLVNHIEGQRRYIQNNINYYKEQSTRMFVNKAINDGILTRPKSCSKCGQETKIVGHHSDYEKPLEITWLCNPCHRKLHLITGGED